MLQTLKLENYRCFEEHEIDFKNLTIIVGKNNAGKSTIIEALRLVSIVASRNLNFLSLPKWLDLPIEFKGVSPSLVGLDFSVKNIFHNYNDSPAKITATFKNKARIVIYIGVDAQVFALIFDKEGQIRKSKQALIDAGIPEINILPQISALAKDEIVLGYEYVRSNITTQLSSLHFRNQIHYFEEHFTKFKDLSEITWPGLGINKLEGNNLFKGDKLTLMIRDTNFAAEIGWMGHGLQMWLQTMWFLSKSKEQSTVILDEPDVYMHADLQRKLIRFLKNKYNQVILATHSIEIITEVEPENILIIDKSQKKSIFATSVPAVQNLISNIGSIQNIGLARLWSSQKLLLVEGKDIDILKRIQDTLFGNQSTPFDIIPRSSIGGWGGWNYVIGAEFVLKNGLKQSLNVYCIFDSDYHSSEEIDDRYREAKQHGIILHVWSKKEIENYLISPPTMQRIIQRTKKSSKFCNSELIVEKLNQIAEDMKISIIDKFADEIQSKNRKWSSSTINKAARQKVESIWHDKFNIISGKELLTEFNRWCNTEYKTSVSSLALAREINKSEIPNEMKIVITAIERNTKIYVD